MKYVINYYLIFPCYEGTYYNNLDVGNKKVKVLDDEENEQPHECQDANRAIRYCEYSLNDPISDDQC